MSLPGDPNRGIEYYKEQAQQHGGENAEQIIDGIEELGSHDPVLLAGCYETLKKAGKNARQVARGLITLDKKEQLSSTLDIANQLTPENIDTLIEAKEHAEAVARGLLTLAQWPGLLNKDSREALVRGEQHAGAVALAFAAIIGYRKRLELLTPDNCAALGKAQNRAALVARGLIILADNQLLTQKNRQALVDLENVSLLITALDVLKKRAEFINQENFEALLKITKTSVPNKARNWFFPLLLQLKEKNRKNSYLPFALAIISFLAFTLIAGIAFHFACIFAAIVGVGSFLGSLIAQKQRAKRLPTIFEANRPVNQADPVTLSGQKSAESSFYYGLSFLSRNNYHNPAWYASYSDSLLQEKNSKRARP